MKNDEWYFEPEYLDLFLEKPTCFRAMRNGVSLWVGWGAKHCEIEGKPEVLGKFGVLVWHLSAKKRVKELEMGIFRQCKADIFENENKDSFIGVEATKSTITTRKQNPITKTEIESK